MRQYTNSYLADLLPYPAPNAYKYSRGTCTLVVGSTAYPGAACLAGMASQKAGAGYTEVYVDDPIIPLVQQYRASFVVKGWNDWSADADLKYHPGQPHAYVVGCGFDVEDPYIAGVTRQLLKAAQGPIVVDGGALRMLSARKIRDLCSKRYAQGRTTIITPHRGEANTLASVFGVRTDDPEHLAYNLSRAYGAIAVLKGPDTYISTGDETFCMTEGTAVLSKAGTGDVLAGVIGGLLAQGVGPLDACVLGATLHARAGNLAARDLGVISVCAEDVIDYLPAAIVATEADRVITEQPETQDSSADDSPEERPTTQEAGGAHASSGLHASSAPRV